MTASLLLAICLPTVGQIESSAALQTPISMEIRGKLAPKAIEEIALLSGVSLSVSPIIAGEPLILRVRNRPVGEVLEKIARVMTARWEREASGLRLIRTKEDIERRDVSRIEAVAGKVKSLQAEYRDLLARIPVTDRNRANELRTRIDGLRAIVEASSGGMEAVERSFEQLRSESPVARLFYRVFTSVEPRAIAAIRPGSRLVLSDKPNRMQKAMPKEAISACDSFAEELRLWSEAISPLRHLVELRQANELNAPHLGSLPQIGRPSKYILTVRNPNHLNAGRAELLILDSRGKIIWSWFSNIDVHRIPAFAPIASSGATQGSRSPIFLSRESEELVARYQQIRSVAPGFLEFTPSAELRNVLLNPHSSDPSKFTLSDLVLGVADDLGTNVAAAPGWAAGLQVNLLLTRQRMTHESFWKQLGSRWMGIEGVRQGDWLLFEPVVPFTEYRTGADRASLVPLLKSHVEGLTVSLETAGEFAAKHELMSGLEQLILYGQALRPFDSIIGAWGDPYLALRIHGLFTPAQRQELRSGKLLQVSRLSPAIRELVRRIVFESSFPIRLRDERESFESEDYGHQPSDARSEPTEAFPNGIPAFAALRLTTSQEEGLHICWKSSGGTLGYTRIEELADAITSPQKPDDNRPHRLQSGESMLRTYSTRLYKYAIELGGGLYVNVGLAEPVELTPWVKSWDQLPEGYVRRIRAEIDRLGRKPPPVLP